MDTSAIITRFLELRKTINADDNGDVPSPFDELTTLFSGGQCESNDKGDVLDYATGNYWTIDQKRAFIHSLAIRHLA